MGSHYSQGMNTPSGSGSGSGSGSVSEYIRSMVTLGNGSGTDFEGLQCIPMVTLPLDA